MIRMDDSATFYIVATPIGNREDITLRALEVLKNVDVIYAEDTRHSHAILQHYGIPTRTVSLHEHNEEQRIEEIITLLQSGKSAALISDAGTPLIQDPGFKLVRSLREAGCKVIPIPGASAAICALSAAGLPTDQFHFAGFLPVKKGARDTALASLNLQTCTILFYESKHRIMSLMDDLIAHFGGDRKVVIARELTKTFESWYSGNLETVRSKLAEDDHHTKGEFVVMLEGLKTISRSDADRERVLKILLAELPVKQAAKLAAKLLDENKNAMYEMALKLKDQ